MTAVAQEIAAADKRAAPLRTLQRVAAVAAHRGALLRTQRPQHMQVPRSFWSRLAGKYGNKFYWQQNGTEAAINNAVSAINTCLREPAGRFKCVNVQGELGEEPTSGKFGSKLFK
jgi:hypothetical protein